jgi:hypothetical protein
MLELLNGVVFVFNLLSTWRFMVSTLAAATTAYVISLFMDHGILFGWMASVLIILGGGIGLIWQYRFEKRRRVVSSR